MAEYRPSKPGTLVEKKADSTSDSVKHDVSELLKRAPHLELLRSAAQSDEGANMDLRDALLEDFRRMVTEDDGRIVPTPVPPDRADEAGAKLTDLGRTEGNMAEAISRARDRAKRS